MRETDEESFERTKSVYAISGGAEESGWREKRRTRKGWGGAFEGFFSPKIKETKNLSKRA